MFEEGKEQTIEEVLAHRDKRVQLQKETLEKNKNVITVSLNIPGPIKNNDSLMKLAQTANDEVQKRLPLLKKEGTLCDSAGCDFFYATSLPASTVKEKLIQIEEEHPLGRLFDLDVQFKDQDGNLTSISRQDLGFPARRCLICGREAKYCARSRQHDTTELQCKIEELWQNYLCLRARELAQKIAGLAVNSLCYEAVCQPKPGLVDPVDTGSHQDMDIFSLLDSATSLYPYFLEMFCLGVKKSGSVESCFSQLRQLGQKTESNMFQVTNQVNTHKGAIFSFALTLCALGRCLSKKERVVTFAELKEEIRLLSQPLINDFDHFKSKEKLSFGEQLYLKEKIRGVRGEALTGFTAIFDDVLPFYQSQTGDLQKRLLNTLFWILLHITDTTLIKRSHNVNIMQEVAVYIQHFFDLGGASTDEGYQYLIELNQLFKEKNWSIGGSADCLALTVFLDQLEKNGYICK